MIKKVNLMNLSADLSKMNKKMINHIHYENKLKTKLQKN